MVTRQHKAAQLTLDAAIAEGCPYVFVTKCDAYTNGETFCPSHAKCDCGYPMAHNGECDPRYLNWVDGFASGSAAGYY